MLTATPFIQKLVDIASSEFAEFHELDESDEALETRIMQYCDEIGIRRPTRIENFAWSATFVSWCVKAAGATSSEFVFSPRHAVFVKAAIANADRGVGVFRARPIEDCKPKVGDIIHRNRGDGHITYKQARNRSSYESHSAIVVDIIDINGKKLAVTIGGNEGNSIRRQRVRLTADGHVMQTESNPYICVIEDLKVDAPSFERAPEFVAESVMDASDRSESQVLEDRVLESRGLESGVLESVTCEAGGDVDDIEVEARPEKPPTRQDTSPNKSSRGGARIDHIVVHYTTSWNIGGTISHFKNRASKVSAHYIVGQDGVLVQMVPDAERAWHAGKSAMNARSIGIEHVAQLGDKITAAQSATSIALIRYLMDTYRIPVANIIPHVCVKPTTCCGDLFKDFGGGAGLSCRQQGAAVQRWLAANGIGGGVEAEDADIRVEALVADPVLPEAATSSQRLEMAKCIVNFEARRDSQGRLAIYYLPPGDGGGRYEVAGINERYHKAVCDELVELIRAGRHADAELRAAQFIANYTDKAGTWTQNPGVEFYLRDTMFNRGPGGAAWILQKAVGVAIDRNVGPATLAAVRLAEARPSQLLDRLRDAREAYERQKRDESSMFWRGLVNRWNKARQLALSFMEGPEANIYAAMRPEMLTLQSAVEGGVEPAGFEKGIPFIDDGSPNAPSFHDIGNESSLDDPEKMLSGIRAFRNDLDLGIDVEVAIGLDTSLPSAFLEAMATRRRAVGKISTSGVNFLGGNGSWMGTGFLVGKNILLTNHHVLNSQEVASQATVDFTFEVPIADLVMGTSEPSKPSARLYRLDPAKLFITSPVSNGLDYTFVWIEDDAERTCGSIPMVRSAFSVAKGERAFIIHHPHGHGRRVSLDENNVLRMTTSILLYTTDTEPGSSGSPAFDRQARLIALHHASTRDPDKLPPELNQKVLNEGIKIAAIVADLEARTSGAEGPMAQKVLEVVQGSDTMSGFFGSLGRSKNIASDATGVERVVDVYKGSDHDVDIGFWNIEWLANRYDDREKLRLAAFLIVDLGLDIWGLEEVSPAAVRALVNELDVGFGEKYSYALSEPEAGDNKQSTAVIWKTKTVNGSREEWPDDIERLWHMRSDDPGLEAVEGKIFDHYPGLFRFSMKREGAPFEFYVVPLHLKAMAEGSKRRRQASRLLAYAVKTMTEKYNKSRDWVIGGDLNANLSSNDFVSLVKGDFVPLSAEDEQAGAFTYLKSPNSLIDHIFLTPNLAQQAGADSYFIVARDKSVDKYASKLSDHRPVLVRISLADREKDDDDAIDAIDEEIARVMEGRDAVPTSAGVEFAK